MKKIQYLILTVILIFVFSCEPEIERMTPGSGDADFSVLVTVGNSLTAGYADLDLYRSGQENSVGNLIARQMMHTGLQEFNQPLMYDEFGIGQRVVLAMVTDCTGPNLGVAPAGGIPDPRNFQPLDNSIPYHNMGVPGATVGHLLQPGYGLANIYYGRFAKNPASSSILDDAMSHQPTFFTLWIGNNDVLSYATSGGMANGVTPVEDFQQDLTTALYQLTANGAKGVIANVPLITEIPFFTTIPYNGLVLQQQSQVDQLNSAYAQLPHINFSLGANPFVVNDPGSPGGRRQLEPGELVLLSTPQANIRCNGYGSTQPIGPQHYLSKTQVDLIMNTTHQYNQVIANLAAERGLALVDFENLLESALTGYAYDGVTFTTQYATGGLFSIDGIHLTKRGSALVANLFIESINNHYGSTIPKLIVSEFDGIIFP